MKGYTVTADYAGTVSRINLNKTRYVAIFEGTSLNPDSEEPTASPNPDVADGNEVDPTAPDTVSEGQNMLVPVCVVLVAALGIGVFLIVKRRKGW